MVDWLQKHMLVTVLLTIWLLGVVTWVTWRVFSADPPDIPTSTVTALGIVYGLPAVAVGLWKWRGELISRRGKDE